MAIFRCKMCGGDLVIEGNSKVAECEYCGSLQTVAAADDEKKITLFNRANRLRMNNEFDKASGVYEAIVADFPEEAEAYWGLILCQYGIEYVDDPNTAKKVPTCHRSSFDSIMDDNNFELVMEYADTYSRRKYREEAKQLEEIRKGIIEVSSKEEPYDIFICYKETDFDGERTIDSLIAQDIYDALTEKGYRVFFSRITLEDKLGVEYEPYIFAALNSAKIMLAVGTDYEYYNAVWVKNEWSRFLRMIASGKKKVLIPCYKNIDAYDMPKEFAKLQSQDMGKVGAIQDLLRGIGKILDVQKPVASAESVSQQTNNTATVNSLLKRAFMFLEDGDWANADAYCEKVLDIDPENAYAYLGKLMVNLKITKHSALATYKIPYEENPNYQKALKFADNELKKRLTVYCYNSYYGIALNKMNQATTEDDFLEVANLFAKIKDYKDSEKLAKECKKKAETIKEKIETLQNDKIYSDATLAMENDTAESYRNAIALFEQISDWKDSQEKIELCNRLIEERIAKDREILEQKELKRKKKIRNKFIVGAVIVFVFILILLINSVFIPFINYKKAMAEIRAENYDVAYSMLDDQGKHDVVIQNKNDRANNLLENGQYDDAYKLLEETGNTNTILQNKYDRAMRFLDDGDKKSAYILMKNLNYKDSDAKTKDILKSNPELQIKAASVGDIVDFGKYEQDNNLKNGKETIKWTVLDKADDNRILLLSEYALDCKPYNSVKKDVPWETCSLRKWLNEDFLNTAFNEKEMKSIVTTKLLTPKDQSNAKTSGQATDDKIFLLSTDEAEKYFSVSSKRICTPTEYVSENGAYTGYTVRPSYNCYWWLRTRAPLWYKDCAIYITWDGEIYDSGITVDGGISKNICVRPAMWISID